MADTHPAPSDDSRSVIIPAELNTFITTRLPPSITVALLRYINVYVNYFITMTQVGPAYRNRVCDHAFHGIDKFLYPNAPVDPM